VQGVRGVELAVAADGALRPADAGRVDQGLERAELERLVDGGLDLRGAGDVDGDEGAADLAGELLAVLGPQVRDDDRGAARGQAAGRGRTDARRTAGDDCTCSS